MEYEYPHHDGVFDPAVIGPFINYLDVNDTISVGNDRYYIQMGVNREAYGSFFGSGIAMSETGFHSGNFDFTYMGNGWKYAQHYGIIGATKNYNTVPDNRCLLPLQQYYHLYPNKYIAMHSIEGKVLDRLNLCYYEVMVFGKRFDPCYLLPAPYMTVQGLNGYGDNLLMGVRLDWNVTDNLLFAGDLLVDDIMFNEVVKFNFDTRMLFAAKGGLVYAPDKGILRKASADLTVVMPFMYVHRDYNDDGTVTQKTVNYQNYTNNGIPMGSTLPPDTVALAFSVKTRPVPGLSLNLDSSVSVHGNVSENVNGETAAKYLIADPYVYSTDGSVYNHIQLGSEGQFIDIWDKGNFLNQDHLMTVVQASLSGEAELFKFSWCSVNLTFGYDFEFIHNNGVDRDIYPGQGVHYESELYYDESDKTLKTRYKYGGMVFNTETEATDYINSYWLNKTAEYKQEWADALYDSFNHYFTVGVRFIF